MHKVYRSKIDWWLGLVISVGVIVILGSSVSLLLTPPQDGLPNVRDCHRNAGSMAAFMGWILFSVYYVITGERLASESRILPLADSLGPNREVFPTHNPLSSPALSLDRLRVNYKRPNGRTWWVMISPKARNSSSRISARRLGWTRKGIGWCGGADDCP